MTAPLSLGPVFFNWPAAELRDFYFRVADEAAVDSVHLGEVVCAKRAPFFAPHLADAVERLRAAGKEVVLSTAALPADEREVAAARELAADGDLLVEANDLGIAGLLAGRAHVIGPFVNVYNEGTLAFLAARGAVRVCLPPELPAASLAALAGRPGPELEVIAFGRLPLAISARCFHARARGLHKDGCRFVCGDDPDGLTVRSLDDEPFLAVNGTQTLSFTCCNLAGELGALREMGVGRFRLSPQRTDMVAVAAVFRDILDGRLEAGAATARLRLLFPHAPFANGFFHGVEGRRWREDAAD